MNNRVIWSSLFTFLFVGQNQYQPWGVGALSQSEDHKMIMDEAT